MKNILIKITIILFFILIFIKKDIMYSIIYSTTILWFKNIVPNLLPMFIITSLIINSNLIINICNIFGKYFNKIFKCSNYGIFVYFLSLFTTNYNPLLIYSLLNNYLDKSISIKIIIIIIISNIIVGLLFRNIKYTDISVKAACK